MTHSPIYKILDANVWQQAQDEGKFDGVGIDITDGYIHFSTCDQVAETAAKHFSGRTNLVLVAVDPVGLGAELKWEPSRGGDLFPHLYNTLDLSSVLWSRQIPLVDGVHELGIHDS